LTHFTKNAEHPRDDVFSVIARSDSERSEEARRGNLFALCPGFFAFARNDAARQVASLRPTLFVKVRDFARNDITFDKRKQVWQLVTQDKS
jgi:hypothetical protein